jgi:dephospho-CoA kinase
MTETENGHITVRKEAQAPLLLGLTGVYCAGKNHVARLLEDRGFKILDVDKLGHRVLDLERELILGRFGWEILGKDGAIDRERLGRRVFGKPEELAALEDIIHPRVNRMIMEWIDARKGKPCVIHAALLHRSPVIERLDAIILVQAPVITRLLRARKRDRLSWGQLIKRFHSQKKFAAQYLAQKVDIYTVHNRGYFGFCSRLYRRRLENRIETILSLKGMV